MTTTPLDAVAHKVRRCTACPLHKGRMNAVPGEGNPRAAVMLIGEGPGQREDATGRPFVGAAGNFLEELLATIKLTRDEVFIGNVVKCRPPGNRDPFPDEIETCTSLYLFAQIKLIAPKLIVTLGRHSMRLFLPEDFQISKVHGKAFRRHGQVYLPLYHPAAALYQGNLRETLIADFKKIPAILKKISSRKDGTLGVELEN